MVTERHMLKFEVDSADNRVMTGLLQYRRAETIRIAGGNRVMKGGVWNA